MDPAYRSQGLHSASDLGLHSQGLHSASDFGLHSQGLPSPDRLDHPTKLGGHFYSSNHQLALLDGSQYR